MEERKHITGIHGFLLAAAEFQNQILWFSPFVGVWSNQRLIIKYTHFCTSQTRSWTLDKHSVFYVILCFCFTLKVNLYCDLNLSFNIEVTRSINMAELRKLRRQFISYTKTHPTENTGHISNMFVQYLNKSLHWHHFFICFFLFLYFFVFCRKKNTIT